MTGAADLARMVPGFDFLQGLVKNAGGGLPDLGQWVAPTLKPEEIEKRISELKTVQFWLEQNAKLLGATIQALEVQRMTLATLQGMNLPLADIVASLQIPMPQPRAQAAPAPAPQAAPAPAPAPEAPSPKAKASTPPAAAVDPMQWWGALTQQFSDIAAKAMKEGAASSAPDTGKAASSAARKTSAFKTPARKKAAPSKRKA